MTRSKFFFDKKSNNFIGEFAKDGQVGFIKNRRGLRRKLCNLKDCDGLTEAQLQAYLLEKYQETERALRKDQGKQDSKLKASKFNLHISCARDLWLKEMTLLGKSQKTLYTYGFSLRIFIQAVGDKPVKSLCREDNIQFLGYLRQYQHRGRSITEFTQNRHLRHLAIFFNWCKKAELVQKKIFIEKPSLPVKDMETYEIEDLQRAFTLLNDKKQTAKSDRERIAAQNMQRAFFLASQTLLRIGSIWSLKLSAIDLEKKLIRIRPVEELGFVPKKNKYPNKPINLSLLAFLEEDQKHRGAQEVWFLDDGKGNQWRKQPENISRVATKLFQELGYAWVKPFHQGFRATMITHLLCSGVLVQDVQKLADHSSINTTMKYFNTRKASQITAVEALPELL